MRIVRRYSWWRQLVRLLRFRLIVPLLRSQHPPEHTARGVMIGMTWALTPTVGLQMYGVFVTWLVARRLFNWDFNLVIGAGWTWTTNVLTMLPCYYAFYVTGQLILGTVVGVIAGRAFSALTPDRIRLRRPDLMLRLGLIVAADIARSNYAVALLIPIPTASTPVERLVATGRATPAACRAACC